MSSRIPRSTRFAFAAPTPASPPDRDDQATAEQGRAASLVGALTDLHHHLLVAFPQYTYSDPLVFGGPTTNPNAAYALANEFGSPCQYRVLQVAFTGAGSAAIGQNAGIIAPAATAVLDGSSRVHGQVFTAVGAATVSGADDAWTDLPAGGQVYLAVAVTTDGAFATIQFRRRVSPAGVFSEGHS